MNRSRLVRTLLVATILLGNLLGTRAASAQPTESERESFDPSLREGRGEREIVLIHGLGANVSVWDEIKPYLSRSLDVWTYELHGHGTTQPLADATIEKEAAALDEYLRANDIVYPTLVGHGLGGMIAMRYTFDHPADVYRLIVIDAAPRQLATDEEKVNVARSLVDDYEQFIASRYLASSPHEEVARRVLDMALRTHQPTFISLLMSSFDFDLTDELPLQTVPILVVGSEMLFREGADQRVMLDHLGFGRARSVVFKRIDGSGHYVMLERPVYTASILLAFAIAEESR